MIFRDTGYWPILFRNTWDVNLKIWDMEKFWDLRYRNYFGILKISSLGYYMILFGGIHFGMHMLLSTHFTSIIYSFI